MKSILSISFQLFRKSLKDAKRHLYVGMQPGKVLNSTTDLTFKASKSSELQLHRILLYHQHYS